MQKRREEARESSGICLSSGIQPVMHSQPPEYSMVGAKKGSLWIKFKLGYCPSTKKFPLAPRANVPWSLEEYGKLRGRSENPKAALR